MLLTVVFGSKVNVSNFLYEVFQQCIKVLNYQFYICGVKTSLMAFILFDIVVTLLLVVVFRLFSR